MNSRRKLLVAGLLAALASCATMPDSIEISQQQIQAALARRFPYEARAAEILRVQIGAPRVELLPDANRLRLTFAFEVSERVTRSAVHGELQASFGLRYDPGDATLRLAGVQVERVDVERLPETWRREVKAIVAYTGEYLMEGMVLHTFTPQQLARAQGLQPGDIRVTPTGVRVQLVPRG
jgi:hypothetical protein